ncbi:hypothetical protein AB4254_11600 [Vibrio breoganii]
MLQTRNMQTVLESRIMGFVFESHQIRCLSESADIVRIIVVDAADMVESDYTVKLLAEARFSIYRKRLTFKSEAYSQAQAKVVVDKLHAILLHGLSMNLNKPID